MLPTSPAPQPPFVLSLDIGTSSARALLFDCQGQAVNGVNSRREYHIPTRSDGAVEVDADQLLGYIGECLDEILVKADQIASSIIAVATCTFVSSLVGVDQAGLAITPLITYADTRAAADAVSLRQMLDEETIHQVTGCHFHPTYLPARFLWLAREHPALFKQGGTGGSGETGRSGGTGSSGVHWMSIGEYLALRLFGETAVSYSVASWTGLLNHYELTWDRTVMSVLPITTANLSRLQDADVPFQGLRHEFAARWPALSKIPWFPAIGDGAAANLGSGCVSPHQVAISLGTSSAIRVVMVGEAPPVPKGLWRYRVDRRRALLGGAMSEGGNLFAWLKNILNLNDVNDLEIALAASIPDKHGLTFLPLVSGERSPGWRAEARAALAGLSLATTPLDILQSGLEGITYRLANIFNLLTPLLTGQVEVIASGGAFLHSPAWLSILADALGQPVKASLVAEPSARGVALQAFEALHILDFSQAPTFTGQPHLPNPERHAIYQKAIQRQQDLYQDLYNA